MAKKTACISNGFHTLHIISAYKQRSLSKTYNAAYCDSHAGVKFILSFSLTTWQCVFAISENMQELCECIHKCLQGLLGPPLVPLKHYSTQRDL